MKRNVLIYTFLFVLVVLTSSFAAAQVPMPIEESLIDEYVSNTDLPRRASWWNSLGRQLTYTVDKPVSQVKDVELQNIIFFATNHPNKVKLSDAVPALLNIYKNHRDEQYRLMALAALDAIGDPRGMRRLSVMVKDEPSERVRRITYASLNDYYKVAE